MIILAFKHYQSLRWCKIPSNRDFDVYAVVLSHGDGSLEYGLGLLSGPVVSRVAAYGTRLDHAGSAFTHCSLHEPGRWRLDSTTSPPSPSVEEESPSELGHLMRGKLLAQSLGLGDSSLRTRAPEPSNFGDRPYVWEYLPSFHTFIICCAAQLMR